MIYKSMETPVSGKMETRPTRARNVNVPPHKSVYVRASLTTRCITAPRKCFASASLWANAKWYKSQSADGLRRVQLEPRQLALPDVPEESAQGSGFRVWGLRAGGLVRRRRLLRAMCQV